MLGLTLKKRTNTRKYCYLLLFLAFLVCGEDLNFADNEEIKYISIGNSSLEVLFNTVFSDINEEWKSVFRLFGTPWENSELVGVSSQVSRNMSASDTSYFNDEDANNLSYYRKMEIKYPLGSVKKMNVFQSCGLGTTVLVNYSPMKIKTEYSLYLPFGFNIDPKENKGLTYLMSFVFLGIGSESGNYAPNYDDYYSEDLDSVTISEHYTKITVAVPDSNATESLITLLDNIGLNHNGNKIWEELTEKNELITTIKIINALFRLYYIYKSCLRDENYRIKYIKSGYILNDTNIDKSTRNNTDTDYNYNENDYYNYKDLDDDDDEKFSFHSECELFSSKWEGYMSQISASDLSLLYSLNKDKLTEEEEKKILSPQVFEWIFEMKRLITAYFVRYWKSEIMSLFIDSSIDTKVFENILSSRLSTSIDKCIREINHADLIRLGANNGGKVDNFRNDTDVTVSSGHVNDENNVNENYVQVFNIVPLYYKLSILDIELKIKMNNMIQMLSVSLSKVMDLVETLYLDTIKKWLKEEELIKGLSVNWKLHYETLVLSVFFRFKLNRKKLDKIINIIYVFRSYTKYILGLIRKNGTNYEIRKDLVELADELQRLYEIRWHSQYIFDDEETILTTPLEICGIPTQLVKKNERIHSNWVKSEVRLYSPVLFKLYPNFILHSIHRSYVRFPGECKGKSDCNLFRLSNGEIVKEPLDTGNSIFLLLEYIMTKIAEFKGTVMLTDPYFRYKTKYEMKLETYNHHEYMNLHFNIYSKPMNSEVTDKDYESLTIRNMKWELPNSIVNLDSNIKIPVLYGKNVSTRNIKAESRINPNLMYRNSLGFAIKLDNFELNSPLIFIKSILRTKLDICDVYKYSDNGSSICNNQNIVKKHSKLAMTSILLLIINKSICEFLENEPFDGYKDILIKSLSNDNRGESKWRKKGTLSKPFHYGSLLFDIDTIELKFVGPESSILRYIAFIFDNILNNFKPLSERDFYIILKDFMEKEAKKRKNRSSIDFIRYYQGIFQYDNVFIDDIFIYTGIYTTYEDYLILFNYIVNSYFDSSIQYNERKIGYLETLILGADNDSNVYKEYTELIQKKVIYKETTSYRYFCLRQENYMALGINDEPIIIRQASSDKIMSTSSASVKFQLPCNRKGSKYDKYKLSSDFFFENGNDHSVGDENTNEYYEWETNDGVEPRCIFNTVVSRVLERILRKHIKSVVNKVVEEIVQDSNNEFITRRKSMFDIKCEVEASFYKLNSISQFTIYILSTNFDTFTLLSILKRTLDKLKTDVIENSTVLSDHEFSIIKKYFINYYCNNDNIQIRNIRLTMIEMSRWRYNFNWKYESCNVVKEISRNDIVDFFNDYFSKNSPYRRSFVLLVQGPPFKQLISTKGNEYDQNSLIQVYHTFIQSLVRKEQPDKHKPNYVDEQKIEEGKDKTKDRCQSLNLEMINNYSYPDELKTDKGILSFKEGRLKRYQPRCPNFILDIFNIDR
ncbi:hypothetical protein FG386_000564 [Cryptosporidium ryanae]|uniref:uncharacterized protein n=1 Tax=Cryptosporidium ryanae TaxID=515981 RepID=UPI00351A610A|nr:hypothetical protein FG386_000564 [Cryptosporidium ryanae]